MAEYQIKLKIITGSLLPPYAFQGIEIVEAKTAKEAIEKAKAEYAAKVGLYAEEYPLLIEEVTKL